MPSPSGPYPLPPAAYGPIGSAVVTVAVVYAYHGNNEGTVDSFNITNDESILVKTAQQIDSGENTVTCPTNGAHGCWFIPPSTNVENITLRGGTGDTGVPLHKTCPSFITLSSGDTNFIILASDDIPDPFMIIWI